MLHSHAPQVRSHSLESHDRYKVVGSLAAGDEALTSQQANTAKGTRLLCKVLLLGRLSGVGVEWDYARHIVNEKYDQLRYNL